MRKYFISIALVLFICMIATSSTICCAFENTKILYIKDKVQSEDTIQFETSHKNIETKILNKNEKLDKGQIDRGKIQTICLSKESVIENIEFLKGYLNENKRIVVLNKKITKKELAQALKIEFPALTEELEKQLNNKKVLEQLGILVYKTSDGMIRMINMNVESTDNEEKDRIVENAVLDASNLDATRYNEGKFGLLSASSLNSWNSMNFDSGVDYWRYIRVRWSLQLYKDPSNPVSGKYKTCAEYFVKPEMTNVSSDITPYILETTYVTIGANSDSGILSVSPSDKSSSFSTSYSLSYPWGVSVSVAGGETNKITTVSGGVGSNQVTKQYKASGSYTQEADLVVTAQRVGASTSYSGSYTVYYTELQLDGTVRGTWYVRGGKTLGGSASN